MTPQEMIDDCRKRARAEKNTTTAHALYIHALELENVQILERLAALESKPQEPENVQE